MYYTRGFLVCAAVVILTIPDARSQPMGRQSLKDLPGVYLIVEELDEIIEENGLSRNEIESDVKKKLQKADIEILSEKEMQKTPGMPWLYVSIGSGTLNRNLLVYTINMELVQSVMLVRDAGILCNASTWKSSGK